MTSTDNQKHSRNLVHAFRQVWRRSFRSKSQQLDDVVLHGYADEPMYTQSVTPQYRQSLDGRPRTADAYDQARWAPRRSSMERIRTAVGAMWRPSYIEQDLKENHGIRYNRVGERNYIADIPYMLPSDKDEQLRLDALHFYLKVLLRDNHLVPLSKRQASNILDIGHGSGIWVMEMARAYPNACIVGVDVANTELPFDIIPHNVNFQRVDVLDGLPYMSGSFDIVHQRLFGMGMPADKWESALEEHFRVLKPGGYVQIDEFDLAFENGGPISQSIQQMMSAVAQNRKIDLTTAARIGDLLTKVGFVDVQVQTFQLRYSSRAGALGERFFWNMHDMVQSMIPLASIMGYSASHEVERLMPGWKEECSELETFQTIYVYTAQKPAPAPAAAAAPETTA